MKMMQFSTVVVMVELQTLLTKVLVTILVIVMVKEEHVNKSLIELLQSEANFS